MKLNIHSMASRESTRGTERKIYVKYYRTSPSPPDPHCKYAPPWRRPRSRRSFARLRTRAPWAGGSWSWSRWWWGRYPVLGASTTTLAAGTPLCPRGPRRAGARLNKITISHCWGRQWLWWRCGWFNWGDDEADWLIRCALFEKGPWMHPHGWCTDNNASRWSLHKHVPTMMITMEMIIITTAIEEDWWLNALWDDDDDLNKIGLLWRCKFYGIMKVLIVSLKHLTQLHFLCRSRAGKLAGKQPE